MDYYYALLNSYDLLKKRKFKLSLREQEKGSATQEVSPEAIEQAADEAEAALKKAVEQPPQETAVETNLGVNRDISLFVDGTGTQSGDKDAMHRTVRVGGVEGAYGSTIKFKATEIENIKWTKKNTNGYKLARAWAGAGAGGEDTGGETDPEAQLAIATQVQGVGDSIPDDVLVSNDDMEDVDDEEDKARLIEEARIAEVDRLQTVAQNSADYGDLSDQEIIDTFEAVGEFLKVGDEVSRNRADVGEGKYTLKINELIRKYKITIDENRCLKFNGIGTGACAGDDNLSVAMQRSLEVLETAQEEQKHLGIANPANQIPAHEPDEYNRASSDVHRGIAIEDADNFSPMLERCEQET